MLAVQGNRLAGHPMRFGADQEVHAQAPAKAQRGWRQAFLATIPFLLLARVYAGGPIAQDPAYHEFADQRRLLGVPHFFDVASSLPFLFVGVAGMLLCLGALRPPRAASWFVFFAGIALAAFGSGYYHWAPGDAALFWDRLPMTIAVTALLVALVSEQVGERLERWLLGPALLAGVARLLWWRESGDLRLYFCVQLAPLICLPYVLLLFRRPYTHRHFLACALALFVLAKLAEAWDLEIFALSSGAVSGHTLNHLFTAAAALCIYVMLRQRKPATRRALPAAGSAG